MPPRIENRCHLHDAPLGGQSFEPAVLQTMAGCWVSCATTADVCNRNIWPACGDWVRNIVEASLEKLSMSAVSLECDPALYSPNYCAAKRAEWQQRCPVAFVSWPLITPQLSLRMRTHLLILMMMHCRAFQGTGNVPSVEQASDHSRIRQRHWQDLSRTCSMGLAPTP